MELLSACAEATLVYCYPSQSGAKIQQQHNSKLTDVALNTDWTRTI